MRFLYYLELFWHFEIFKLKMLFESVMIQYTHLQGCFNSLTRAISQFLITSL